jgi:hypothetical protein
MMHACEDFVSGLQTQFSEGHVDGPEDEFERDGGGGPHLERDFLDRTSLSTNG